MGQSSFQIKFDGSFKQRSSLVSGDNKQISLRGVGADQEKTTDLLGRTLQSPDTQRSVSEELVSDDNKRKLSEPMLKEIRAIIETLEQIQKDKIKQHEDFVEMINKKAQELQPDYLQYKKDLKMKIRGVRNRLIQELDEMFDP